MKLGVCLVLIGTAFVALTVGGTQSYAQTTATQSKYPLAKTAAHLVSRYCKADFDGAMLSAASYQRSGLSSITIAADSMGPAWDTAVLVQAFHVLANKELAPGKDSLEVKVEYSVLGEWAGAGEPTEIKRTEQYVFHVRQVHGTLKLIEPIDLPPHISINAAIKHMRSLLQTQADAQPDGQLVLAKLLGMAQE